METLLSSGLAVFHVPAAFPPTTAIGILIPRGHLHDPGGREGLHALLSGVLLKAGSGFGSDALQSALDRMGALMEASSDMEYTLLSMEVLESHTEGALALLFRVFDEAVIPARELRLARRGMKASLRMSFTDPDYVTEAHLFSLAFGPGHPLGRPLTPAGLNAIGMRDLQSALPALRGAPRCSAFVVTPTPFGDIHPLLARAAHLWRVPQDFPPACPGMPVISGVRVRLIPRKAMTQVCFQALLPVPARPAADYLPLRLSFYSFVEGGFSARLMRRLRVEIGSTYGISGQYKALRDFGYLHLSAMINRAQAVRARALILEEYARWRDSGPDAEELEEARIHSLKAFPMIQDNPLELGSLLLKNHLHGLPSDFVETYEKRLRAVTMDDVMRAHRSLPADIPVWAAAGERSTLRACFSGISAIEERAWNAPA